MGLAVIAPLLRWVLTIGKPSGTARISSPDLRTLSKTKTMYNKYFGFLELPFSVTPDPRFFYLNRVYQEAFAILHYGIEAKKGFIVVTGEVGTGKTTLLRKLMRNLEGTVHSVFIFNTHLDFPGLLQFILRDLGLATEDNDRVMMIEKLNRYLIEQLTKGHIVSVLIDEAQNLTNDALEGLRLLSNLETDKEKLLQIVLMGQPELERKLDQPSLRQLKQRVALHCQLAPLEEKEVAPYINFRLRAAGYAGDDLFDGATIQQIAFYSRGIPRLINIICDNALLNAYATSQKRIARQMIDEVASDLRLKARPEVVNPDVFPIQARPLERKEAALHTLQPFRLQDQPRWASRLRVRPLFAVLLVLVGIASLFDMIPNSKNFPATLFENSTAGARLETFSPRSSKAIDTPKVAAKDLTPEQESSKVTISLAEDLSPTSSKTAAREQYTIKANDTLSKLAEKYYGTPWKWEELYSANKKSIKNPDYIYIGQKITIPAD